MEKCNVLGSAMMRACQLLAVALFLAFPARAAQTDHVRLRASDCHDVSPAFLATLSEDWHVLGHYVQLCPVFAPDGTSPLSVLTVRMDYAEMRDNYFEAHRDPISKPITVILDQQNHVVGELLDGFPEDPPSNLQVSFTDWHNGFPWRVDLYDAGEAVMDPSPEPSLFWDERQRRYVEGPKLRWDAQRHRSLEGPTLVWDAGQRRYVIKPSLIYDERHRWFVEAPTRAAPSQ